MDFTKRQDQIKILFISLGMAIFMLFLGYFIFAAPALRTKAAKDWTQTEAAISFMGFKGSGDETEFDVRYVYTFAGRKFEATRYAYVEGWESCPIPLCEGMKIKCFVNPANPVQSIITHKYSKGFIFWLLLPLSIFILSLGGFAKALWCMIFYKSSVQKEPITILPASYKIKSLIGAAIFIGLGVFFANLIIKPLVTKEQVDSWQQIPCVIHSIEVKEKGKEPYWETYVDISYSYEFEGRRYNSIIYKREYTVTGDDDAVELFAPGAKATCYVNLANPAEAVMVKPQVSGLLYMGMAIPIVFITIGIGIILYIIRHSLYRKSGD